MSSENYLPIEASDLSTDFEALVKRYFGLGLTYTEIIGFLQLHGVTISYRHLQRKLRDMGLRRRSSKSDPNTAVDAVELELSGTGGNVGYRHMQQRLMQKHQLVISRESVRIILRYLDPIGVDLRRQHKLHRRLYSVPGPNYLWHIDGWDKLKPFGLCIHGCIDGFSRRLLWLEASPSNKNPYVICDMFVDCIRRLNGIPCTVRADRGTENVNIEIIQKTLANQNEHEVNIPFLYGKSTANQRIESFWSKLTVSGMGIWINHFKELSNAGIIDTSDELNMQCVIFSYMPVLRTELKNILELWNTHHIRKSQNQGPNGRPDVMFYMPELFDGKNCLQRVNLDELDVLAETLTNKIEDCINVYQEIFSEIVQELHIPYPKTLSEADDMLVSILDEVEYRLYMIDSQ